MAIAASGGRISAHVAYENVAGLPQVYNAAMVALPDDVICVLVHDDVSLYDYHLAQRLDDGLAVFDVIGVAGNAAPAPDHVGWYYRRTPAGVLEAHDLAALSGTVDNLNESGERFMTRFGPAPRQVELLDGLLLAFRAGTARSRALGFDTRFRFHFYDLDFCRQCVARGLRLGTWPLALGHSAEGDFESAEWEAALAAYRDKWAGA